MLSAKLRAMSADSVDCTSKLHQHQWKCTQACVAAAAAAAAVCLVCRFWWDILTVMPWDWWVQNMLHDSSVHKSTCCPTAMTYAGVSACFCCQPYVLHIPYPTHTMYCVYMSLCPLHHHHHLPPLPPKLCRIVLSGLGLMGSNTAKAHFVSLLALLKLVSLSFLVLY